MRTWIAMTVVLGTLYGCKHPEPLPSERLYLAAIAPASERSLGPMPDHVPEPNRGDENVPENVPTHGPEHGTEGRPENVPADQMPVEPGPEPGPEPGVAPGPEQRPHRPHRPEGGSDDGEGQAFKPEIAKRQAPTVLGNIGAAGRPTSEEVLQRRQPWLPPEEGFSLAIGEESLGYRPPADVIRWHGEIPMRDGVGQIDGVCFVRFGRVTFPCNEEEKQRVARDLLLARVLYWRNLGDVATLSVPTHEKVVVHSKDERHRVVVGIRQESGRIHRLSTSDGGTIEGLSKRTFQPVPIAILWESGDLVADGVMSRTDSDEFWGICADYTGPLDAVSERVQVLEKRVASRGAVTDPRHGLVVEPDGASGGRVCLALMAEVDGASRFRSKPVAQRWHRGKQWTSIVQTKPAIEAWLKDNDIAAVTPKRWRIRIFETPAVIGPADGVAVLELMLAAAPETP